MSSSYFFSSFSVERRSSFFNFFLQLSCCNWSTDNWLCVFPCASVFEERDPDVVYVVDRVWNRWSSLAAYLQVLDTIILLIVCLPLPLLSKWQKKYYFSTTIVCVDVCARACVLFIKAHMWRSFTAVLCSEFVTAPDITLHWTRLISLMLTFFTLHQSELQTSTIDVWGTGTIALCCWW